MKLDVAGRRYGIKVSLPVRGAWIEMSIVCGTIRWM